MSFVSATITRRIRHPLLRLAGINYCHISVENEGRFLITNLKTGTRLLDRLVTQGKIPMERAQTMKGKMSAMGLVPDLAAVFVRLAGFKSPPDPKSRVHFSLTPGEETGYACGCLDILGLDGKPVRISPILTQASLFNLLATEANHKNVPALDAITAIRDGAPLPLDSAHFLQVTGKRYGYCPSPVRRPLKD